MGSWPHTLAGEQKEIKVKYDYILQLLVSTSLRNTSFGGFGVYLSTSEIYGLFMSSSLHPDRLVGESISSHEASSRTKAASYLGTCQSRLVNANLI